MLGRLNAWMPQGSYLRNVSILTGGTMFAQGLMVLALPVLTRLYTPEDFNLLAVYVSTVGLVTVFSCLRYNIAIPLPRNDADGMALLALSLIMAVLISLLCAVPVFLAPEASAAVLEQPELAPFLWMIPLGILISSIYNALQYWASRKKRFGLVAKTRINRAVGGVGTQLGAGIGLTSAFGLLFGHMIYGGLGIFALGRNILREDRECLGQVDMARLKSQAIAYRRFPLYSVPESLSNTAGIQLPIILIAAQAAGPEAAFLLLATRVIGMPMSLIGGSVAQVFLAEAPGCLGNGTLGGLTRSTMWALFKVGAPPMVLVGTLSPLLFPLVFGAEWSRAGLLVAWMTPWYVLQFVASPVSMVFHVVGKQLYAMLLAIFSLVLRLAVVIAALAHSPGQASEFYALSGLVFCIVYLMAIAHCANTLGNATVDPTAFKEGP